MKTVAFQQTGRVVQVKTEANVLQALLSEKVPVKMACGGRGICATCHVFVDRGQQALTPKTKSEIRTLGILGDAEPCSRLACQAKVIGDGVVVRLPRGLFIEKSTDLLSLVGRRAEEPVLHPVHGRVLVEEGKIITRSVVEKLRQVEVDLQGLLATTRDA